jgi:uncharacterized protein (TIGR04255 family)
MQLPSRIENCPIIDAIIEIRFESKIFSNAVFGLIYNEIEKDYPGKVELLPILQIPEQLRAKDPNFRFKPQYKITNERFIIQIGSDVIAISTVMPYTGWDVFNKHVSYILKKIFAKEIIIKSVFRIGHRYVNFFDGDILSKLNICLQINNKQHIAENTHITTEIPNGEFSSTLQITNNGQINRSGNISKGTIIDIDTFKSYKDQCFMENCDDELNSAHIAEKELFFSLLKEDFLVSLKPTYNGD